MKFFVASLVDDLTKSLQKDQFNNVMNYLNGKDNDSSELHETLIETEKAIKNKIKEICN